MTIVARSLGLMSLVSGPQMLRHDFRQDLRVADVLKMYPMPAGRWFSARCSRPPPYRDAQWALLLAALLCSTSVRGGPAPMVWRIASALAAALVLPFVDFLALLLPNGAALIFPAWVQLGKDAPRGIETMGQQIILMFGQMRVLLLAPVPAGLAPGAAYFVAR